jgi:hypothetical protein
MQTAETKLAQILASLDGNPVWWKDGGPEAIGEY